MLSVHAWLSKALTKPFLTTVAYRVDFLQHEIILLVDILLCYESLSLFPWLTLPSGKCHNSGQPVLATHSGVLPRSVPHSMLVLSGLSWGTGAAESQKAQINWNSSLSLASPGWFYSQISVPSPVKWVLIVTLSTSRAASRMGWEDTGKLPNTCLTPHRRGDAVITTFHQYPGL